MPRRSIKKSNPGDFEPRKRNPISLGLDSNLENDFKELRIGGLGTGLEFSLYEIKSTVYNFATHKETTQQLNVTSLRGNKAGSPK